MTQALKHLFEPSELLAVKGIEIGSTEVGGLSFSSTDSQTGSLFFAIKGTSADGHQFAESMLSNGAVAAVVESQEVFDRLERAILVHSTRALLGKVASRFWGNPTENFGVVAVTGTNGKTTTTHLLEQAWTQAGEVCGMVGTIRYQVGQRAYPAPLTTPDALSLQKLWAEMAQAGVRFAAIEASSIALDQFRLSGTKVRVAVFTNLTQDHLDYHESMENYYESKKRLFTEFHPATAVIGIDDAWGRRLVQDIAAQENTSCPLYTFSVSGEPADFQLIRFETGAEKVTAVFQCLGTEHTFETRLLGRHNLANILAATAALVAEGWDVKTALGLLTAAPGAPGRLERVGLPGACEVLVDYAHSEDALEQVLRSLSTVRDARRGRIITVFGCGGDRDRLKRPRMASVVSNFSDITVVTSDNPRTEEPSAIIDDIEKGIEPSKTQYVREVDRRNAIFTALGLARAEDVVLIAGKGHETYQILGREKVPFDDREVVREYFQSCSPTSA